MSVATTTLWEYPSQHYVSESGLTEQGDRDYVGATPSWVIWQVLQRATKPGDVVLDPMCGSGTTLDVARDLDRRGVGFDLAPPRPEVQQADARRLPLPDESVDFVFIDPPYSTHVRYSERPECIGRLDAGGEDRGEAYYAAMDEVFAEADRVLKPDRCMAVFVSDSYRKGSGRHARCPRGKLMPIGFELFRLLRRRFAPLDIVCVVRRSSKLDDARFHKAAAEEGFLLRGFNYLFLMRKPKRAVTGRRPEGREDRRVGRRRERADGGRPGQGEGRSVRGGSRRPETRHPRRQEDRYEGRSDDPRGGRPEDRGPGLQPEKRQGRRSAATSAAQRSGKAGGRRRSADAGASSAPLRRTRSAKSRRNPRRG